MKNVRDEAYVLGTHQLGEADLIVTLLAERAGRVRGVARGARKSRRRFGGALEPLTRVRANWHEREGRELHQIQVLEPTRSYAPMQADPVRQAACAVLSEILGATVREGQADPKLFRLVGAVLDALEDGLHPLLAVRYFEFWALRIHGLLPELSRCGGCSSEIKPTSRCWGTAEHGLLCASCRRSLAGEARLLTRGEREFLRAAPSSAPGEIERHAGAASGRGGLELLLRGTLQSFVERPLKTYRHLQAAIQDPSRGEPRR